MGISLIPGSDARGKAGGTATPLLGYLAGEHAGAIAAVWRAPHASFLALPSARRHAAAILLHRVSHGDLMREADEIAMAVERARDKDVATLLAGKPVPGLMKAMGRMGETLWKPADYERFIALFVEDQAGQILRHMKVIKFEQLELIGELPASLRQPKIVEALPGRNAAQDIAKAQSIILRMKGDVARSDLAARWGRAKNAATLFDMVAEDLRPVAFRGLTPAPALPVPFEPVIDRKMLERVALEFRNCLRDFVADLARGQMAVYIWRSGQEAAVALRADPAGWRLAEVETHGNCGVENDVLREIVDVVLKAGVRTGPGLWTLAKRLHCHGCKSCGPVYRQADSCWREALELGELWDD